MILSDIRKPSDHVFHSGERSLLLFLPLVSKVGFEEQLMESVCATAHNRACELMEKLLKHRLSLKNISYFHPR